jgi:circadian clock protein KaiB
VTIQGDLGADQPGPRWSLTLYVSGASPHSTEAISTVRRICDEDLAGRVDLTVLEAVDHPDQVLTDHILAIPTLVKREPLPTRHLVGNLADADRVRVGLDIGPGPFPGTTSPPTGGTPA